MKHPNEGFLRRFLSTDKLHQEQIKAEQKKQKVFEYYKNKQNKIYTLNEENKSSLSTTINKIYNGKQKKSILEQKDTAKDWEPIQTEYGLYYFNKNKKLWMNPYGVIKNSIGEFIQVIDYETIGSDSKQVLTPEPPSNFQYSLINNLGNINLQWQDNSNNEQGFLLYIFQSE